MLPGFALVFFTRRFAFLILCIKVIYGKFKTRTIALGLILPHVFKTALWQNTLRCLVWRCKQCHFLLQTPI